MPALQIRRFSATRPPGPSPAARSSDYGVIPEAVGDVPPCLRVHGHQERMLGIVEFGGHPRGDLVVAGEGG
jgi:hypothetical protein